MLQLHSASDNVISYLQNFVKERDKRKKEKSNIQTLQQQIEQLEKKLADYEKHKTESLCVILDIISPQ